MRGKHLHHVIPKHMGGTDDESNLVELTIEEHAEAHRLLYEQHGHWQDKLAWKGLSGQIGREEILAMRRDHGLRTNNPMWKQEAKDKISESMKGDNNPMRKFPESNPFLGKSFVKGRKWYNNGVENLYLYIGEVIPEGYVQGMKPQPNRKSINVPN